MSKAVKVFDNISDLARDLAEKLQRISQKEVSIALSGGSTPARVYDEIVQKMLPLNWANIQVFWSDERCVAPDHHESNYLMTKNHLLNHIAIPEENIFRVKGEEEPQQESLRYGSLITSKVGTEAQFDLIILGMGSDGHTASIFPGEQHLWESKNLCEVGKNPETQQLRITFTGTLINKAKEVIFLVTGSSKSKVVGEIINESKEGHNYPAAWVHAEKITWYIDKEAASDIK